MTETAPGRVLPPGLYAYDDLAPGDHVETGTVEVSADLIDRFADLTGDRFAIHIDDAAARDFGFLARVAHGLLVLSLIDGLKNRAPAQFAAVASLGWDWTFAAPVIVGDTIGARFTIAERRATSRPDRGILRIAVEARNGRGEVVQEGSNLLMVRRGGG
jgi:acyl dehydratase